MKLYQHPVSTFSRRVRIALLEKKIDVELVEIDMFDRAHKAAPYLSLNPYGRVPTLVDDDLVLYESTAILEYLEAKYPQPVALVPADIKQRALVSMHMKLCDLQMARQAGLIILSKRFVPQASWRLEEMAMARKELDKHFTILDKELVGKQYLVAERFTLADVCYVPFLEFLHLLEVDVPGNVRAYSERLLSRPSSVATKPAR
jgi:glutathione S-transferase